MNANRKRLKACLVPGVKKLGLASVVPKLGEFPFGDKFFSNLVDFWDLDNI